MKIFPKKSICLVKLKRAKNLYGGKLLENIPEYTKENQIKSKFILIYTSIKKNKLKIHTKYTVTKQHLSKEK
jgi:hypothetical protein